MNSFGLGQQKNRIHSVGSWNPFRSWATKGREQNSDGQTYRILSMTGSFGGSLAIRSAQQARAMPKRKDGLVRLH